MKTRIEDERRRFPRANFLCKVILQAKKKEFTTHTQNISVGGVRILLFEPLAIKEEVSLIIFASQLLKAKGRIIWCVDNSWEGEEEKVFDIGIEFQDLNSADKKFLEELVEKLRQKDK